jgi:hypothetical protein
MRQSIGPCFPRIGVAVLAFVALFAVTTLHGQVDTGSISGTVSDSSGAVVSGAEVTLISEGTGVSLTTRTGADGIYRFSPVRIGSYQLKAIAKGFETESQAGVKVDIQSHVLLNFTLRPGSETQVIEVNSAPPVLQTQDASVGQVVDQNSVNNLPLNGRNFTFLAQLAAGVNTPQADTRGNAASGAFAANGLRPAQNNYLLDGIDNNSDTVDFLNGTNFVVLPPIDAIQEFKVETSDFSAEYGRSGAAVLNATIKSGTNQIHGAVWEFFRNDKLDAADWFEDFGHEPKGELRQNQFGATFGGPIIKNKVFFFGDYEGLRRVQGSIQVATVPTALERTSGYTNLSELITGGTISDDLGRTFDVGTVLDPATTRPVTAGSVDPVTGITAVASGFVRDPFSTCPASTTSFTGAQVSACALNQLPAGRLDPNAVALLKLFPAPNNGNISGNYVVSPPIYEHRNAFDTRMDANFSQKDQAFFRFSYVDDPIFLPGPFTGVADGGAFYQGNQTALAQQNALAYTHIFSPTTINVARAGLNYLHTTREGPEAAVNGLPAQYGIQGVPQGHLNGGIPAFSFSDLNTLGSNSFLPSDETSETLQVTDDFTKIYGKHSFKMGFEVQRIRFSTLQPAWSKGQFNFGGSFTDVSLNNSGTTGIAQFLLTPTANTTGAAGAVSDVGGPDTIYASNINTTYDAKAYYAPYIQDDWKVNRKLTVNLGLRWDYFGLIYERYGHQANFIPNFTQAGSPGGQSVYLIPAGVNQSVLSSSGFDTALAADNIQLKIGGYGLGLGNPQKTDFAPRFGLAYQVTPKLVARGGFGIFYNAFENQGYSPNIGENYPFVFNFDYGASNDWTPLGNPSGTPTPYTTCPALASTGGTATIENGFGCIALNPAAVSPIGLGLEGMQYNFKTPYTLEANLTLQYQLTPTLSAQAAYVTTQARHLQVGVSANPVFQLLPAGYDVDVSPTDHEIPFHNFSGGSLQEMIGASNYNGLQTKLEKRFSGGSNFLVTYTYSNTMSDASDLLNGGNTGNGRAPFVPGFGLEKDYAPANFSIRNVFHLSGGYQLPFGKGKPLMGNAGGLTNGLVGGWSVNAIATLEGGQPVTIYCVDGTAADLGCNALPVPGQSQKLGLHIDSNGELSWFGNPAAFNQPCELGGAPGAITTTSTPTGCVPLSGFGALGGGYGSTVSPGFHRLDFSTFKDFKFSERYSLQFRAEFFNILNHPNFNAPGFSGNGVVAIPNSTNFFTSNFGEIGSTRDAPYDPRQIQFALKFYY